MPLSEDEQRILQDIERSFYESDPGFAQKVGRPTSRRHAVRNCKLAVGGFVLGLVLLLTTFASAPVLLAFAGFILMVASCGLFLRNIRFATSAGIERAANVNAHADAGAQAGPKKGGSAKGSGARSKNVVSLDDARARLRRRFRKG